MSMYRRVTRTVQWQKFTGGVENAHGNVRDTWAPAVDVGIYAFNPGTTQDALIPGSDSDIARPSIYAPTSVVMGARDRVIIDGERYEVDGETRVFTSPFSSRMDGNQIDLRKET